MALPPPVNQLTLHNLMEEEKKWGKLASLIMQHLEIPIDQNIANSQAEEHQRAFVLGVVHLVAIIGESAIEKEWEPERMYHVSIDSVREFARKMGYLPTCLH